MLTKDDVAQICQVSLSTVKRWIATGELRTVHLGHSVRVHPDDLAGFIASRSRCWLRPGEARSTPSLTTADEAAS